MYVLVVVDVLLTCHMIFTLWLLLRTCEATLGTFQSPCRPPLSERYSKGCAARLAHRAAYRIGAFAPLALGSCCTPSCTHWSRETFPPVWPQTGRLAIVSHSAYSPLATWDIWTPPLLAIVCISRWLVCCCCLRPIDPPTMIITGLQLARYG